MDKKKGMRVLSLFDGIACGRLALARAGIDVIEYFASEIEPSCIKIATTRFPDIIELGDIRDLEYDEPNKSLCCANGTFACGDIDMIIGGSPCTDFSSVGYANGMTSGSVEICSLEQYLDMKKSGCQFNGQSYLFWEYVRLLKEVKPKYFLLENVIMNQKWQDVITHVLGVKPIRINSSLVSAQNRPRLYWTNGGVMRPPYDRGIILDKIFDADAPKDDVSDCLTVERSYPRLIKNVGYIPKMYNPYNASEVLGKACTLSRGSMVTSSCATLIFEKVADGVHTVSDGLLDGKYATRLDDGRYSLRKLSLLEMERLQTLPDGYTDIEGISEQKRSQAIGNGWTVDVIAYILTKMIQFGE